MSEEPILVPLLQMLLDKGKQVYVNGPNLAWKGKLKRINFSMSKDVFELRISILTEDKITSSLCLQRPDNWILEEMSDGSWVLRPPVISQCLITKK